MRETPTVPLTSLVETAVQAARAAGHVLMDKLDGHRTIEHKGTIDLVTDADQASELTIVKIIRERFPDHQILAEEGTRRDGDAPYRWVIDPLDGTTNYAHRYPHFSVSIGVELDGEIVVGVVYDPIRDEIFTGCLGSGAFLNNRPLNVSRIGLLLHSLLCTGFPYNREAFGPSLRRWERFVRGAQAVRRDGSAALDICYVAAGRFDGFWENHLRPWDAAAGMLIVREAGGVVTDFHGHSPDIYRGEFVVSNGLIHNQMLGVLEEGEDESWPGEDGTD